MKNIIIDFTKLGGYRLKQATFKKMQETTITYLKALVSFLGCEETGAYIISGCEISGENITAGILYIDGEICPFEETTGDENTFIAKQVTTTSLSFKNGADENVFRELKAVTVISGGTKWSDIVKFNFVKDANYVHTDFNFTLALLNKLNGIEAGAQVNVKPSWTQTNPAAANFIQDKPTGKFMFYLHRNVVVVGNVTDSQVINVDGFDVGTNNYMVIGSLRGYNSDIDLDNDVTFVTSNHTPTSFNLSLDQYENHNQNLHFIYYIVPLS